MRLLPALGQKERNVVGSRLGLPGRPSSTGGSSFAPFFGGILFFLLEYNRIEMAPGRLNRQRNEVAKRAESATASNAVLPSGDGKEIPRQQTPVGKDSLTVDRTCNLDQEGLDVQRPTSVTTELSVQNFWMPS